MNLRPQLFDCDFSISKSVFPSCLHTQVSRQTKISKHVRNEDNLIYIVVSQLIQLDSFNFSSGSKIISSHFIQQFKRIEIKSPIQSEHPLICKAVKKPMYILFCRCYPDYTIYLKTNHYIMHFVECLSKNTLYFIVFITNMKRGFLALNIKTKHIPETIQQSYDRKCHIHLLNNILCSLSKSCQIKTHFFSLQLPERTPRQSGEQISRSSSASTYL